MRFYNNKYRVKQNTDLAFSYFLNRNYFSRFFEKSAEDYVEIVAEREEALMVEGEAFDLLVVDKETIITLHFEVIEIIPGEVIKLDYHFKEVIDREEGTLDDDEEMTSFLQKYIGKKFSHVIQFYRKGDHLEVIETGSIYSESWLIKILAKVVGWYFQFDQRSIYKEIVKEVEAK